MCLLKCLLSMLNINPLTANRNNCILFCHLLVILKVISSDSADADQYKLHI